MYTIVTGNWRDNDATDPMQVVSGPMGKEKVHFEAPASARVPEMMDQLMYWINQPLSIDPVLKSAIAHLWFVTVHPFDDGNGRIGRAIMDRQLAVADGSSKRFYSMSSQILKERKEYYFQLKEAQKGTLDITDYLNWPHGTERHAVDLALAARRHGMTVRIQTCYYQKYYINIRKSNGKV
jgi:Fic family protein